MIKRLSALTTCLFLMACTSPLMRPLESDDILNSLSDFAFILCFSESLGQEQMHDSALTMRAEASRFAARGQFPAMVYQQVYKNSIAYGAMVPAREGIPECRRWAKSRQLQLVIYEAKHGRATALQSAHELSGSGMP